MYDKWSQMKKDAPNSIKIEGENYSIEMNSKMEDDLYWQETTAKFDDYFMYSMDYMGKEEMAMPPCGPDAKYDMCKEMAGRDDVCCTHVTMEDSMMMEDAGSSFYRCMTQKVVDASFSMEINGMTMSMQCAGSGAAYLTGSVIIASIIAMISLASF